MYAFSKLRMFTKSNTAVFSSDFVFRELILKFASNHNSLKQVLNPILLVIQFIFLTWVESHVLLLASHPYFDRINQPESLCCMISH